jgi:hypothetical protein
MVSRRRDRQEAKCSKVLMVTGIISIIRPERKRRTLEFFFLGG